jgi:hypothetical protein
MNDLPDNVQIHKRKKPKNWSYPIQTMELVEGLGLAELLHPVHISYANSPALTREPIGITWQGRQPEPYFRLGVHVVPSADRPFWNKLIVGEVLPVLKKWLHQSHPLRITTHVGLYFQDYEWRDVLRAEMMVNRQDLLWEKEWERDKGA